MTKKKCYYGFTKKTQILKAQDLHFLQFINFIFQSNKKSFIILKTFEIEINDGFEYAN